MTLDGHRRVGAASFGVDGDEFRGVGTRVVIQSFHTVVIDFDQQIGAARLHHAEVLGRILARPEGYRVVAVSGRCEGFQELGIVESKTTSRGEATVEPWYGVTTAVIIGEQL